MLCDYDQYKYVNSYSAGIEFSRQNKVYPRAVRVNHKALKYFDINQEARGFFQFEIRKNSS